MLNLGYQIVFMNNSLFYFLFYLILNLLLLTELGHRKSQFPHTCIHWQKNLQKLCFRVQRIRWDGGLYYCFTNAKENVAFCIYLF